MRKIVFSLVVFCVSALFLQGQTTTVSGIVTDSKNNEPIIFGNVFLLGSPGTGTTTGLQGEFLLRWERSGSDTLVISSIGYKDVKIAVQKSEMTDLKIKMEGSSFDLAELVVIAGENPANYLIRQLIERKEKNDYHKLPRYQAEVYEKQEIDLVNIPKRVTDNKILSQFDYVFQNIDSTSEQKPFLPAYISEEVQQLQQINGNETTTLKARKTANVGNESLTDFLALIHERHNVYDNWINIMEKPFASPFSNTALANYEFYILDSTYLDGRWSSKLKFKPRRKQEKTFEGDFWIDMHTYAVRSVNMRRSPDANINLLGRVEFQQEFQINADSIWVPVKDKSLIEYEVIESDKLPGMLARKQSYYTQFSTVVSTEATLDKTDKRTSDPAQWKKEDTFWEQTRPEPLHHRELVVYDMIDSIGKDPTFIRYKNVMYTLATGFVMWGDVEFGPVFSTYSFNPVEGKRLRFGMGTSYNLSKKLWVYGYGAYGTLDERWKYGGHVQWQISKQPWTGVGVSYKNDLELIPIGTGQGDEGNLFASLYRRNIPQKLFYNEQWKAWFEKDIRKGWNIRAEFLDRRLSPTSNAFQFAFKDPETDQMVSRLHAMELKAQWRYNPSEIFLEANFSRQSMGFEDSRPVIAPFYSIGNYNGKQYYHHAGLELSQWFNVGPLGWTRYQIQAGAISGTLPYLLLHNTAGNETYIYAANAFNTMAQYEFASDRYVESVVVHHFDGFFLNHIPLLRKLKWREVATLRMAYGSLRPENAQANIQNQYDRSYTDFEKNPIQGEGVYYGTFDQGPYLESAIGIENIFKVFRIDATWRMNYLDNRYAIPFSLRGMLTFYF